MDITSFVTKRRDRALLVGDYNSYRRQLSRQLLSLRRKLGRTTPHKAKYTPEVQITVQDVAGNHEFAHYLLLQAERAWAHAMHIKSTHAEDSASKGISGPTRKHIISKLHKAFGYANQLVTILSDRVESKATDNVFLEARAYALCLSGSEEFEKQATKRYDDANVQKQAWSNCLVSFSEAHVIYTALLFSTKKEVFKEVLAGTVDPSIRYAAYQSRISRTIPIPTVAKQQFRKDRTELLSLVEKLNPNALSQDKAQVVKAKDGTSTLDIPTMIKWRERAAPIADAAIGQALAATSIASSNLSSLFSTASKVSQAKESSKSKANSSKTLAAAYDAVLTSAQDTVDAVRRAITDLQKEGISESDQRMQDLRVSDLATNYTLISWRIGRNRVLICGSTGDDGTSFNLDSTTSRANRRNSTKNKDSAHDSELPHHQHHPQAPNKSALLADLRERAVLYDATLQSLDSILTLRGASNSPDFLAEIAQKRAYFQALNCLNIGRSHNLVGSAAAGPQAALALFDRATNVLEAAFPDLAASAKSNPDTEMSDSTPAANTPPTLTITPSQLNSLHHTLRLTTLRQRGLVAIRHYTDTDTAKGTAATATSAAEAAKPPPLIATLNAYPADIDFKNLVAYPPTLQPVPVKPIFLDLAWNYITYPGRPSRDGITATAATAATAMGSKVAGKIAEAVGADAGVVDGQEEEEQPQQQQQERQKEEQAPGRKSRWFPFGRG